MAGKPSSTNESDDGLDQETRDFIARLKAIREENERRIKEMEEKLKQLDDKPK
jgi:hypothetical protein